MSSTSGIPDAFDVEAATRGLRDYDDDPFAAHEAWEDVWRALGRDDPRRSFYQGLIQLAAARVKYGRGQSRGVRKLLDRALPRLLGVPCPWFAARVDVAVLQNAVALWRAVVAGAGATAPPPAAVARLPRYAGTDVA